MICTAPLNWQFLGLKFRPQTPVWPVVSDFDCADHKLTVETDRGQPVESRWDQALDGILAAAAGLTLASQAMCSFLTNCLRDYFHRLSLQK